MQRVSHLEGLKFRGFENSLPTEVLYFENALIDVVGVIQWNIFAGRLWAPYFGWCFNQ